MTLVPAVVLKSTVNAPATEYAFMAHGTAGSTPTPIEPLDSHPSLQLGHTQVNELIIMRPAHREERLPCIDGYHRKCAPLEF